MKNALIPGMLAIVCFCSTLKCSNDSPPEAILSGVNCQEEVDKVFQCQAEVFALSTLCTPTDAEFQSGELSSCDQLLILAGPYCFSLIPEVCY